MEKILNPSMMLTLIIVCSILVIAAITMAFLFYKKNKKDQEMSNQLLCRLDAQDIELNGHGEKIENARSFSKRMSLLMLQEQNSYLKEVAFVLDTYISKNNLQIEHGFLPSEIGRVRNSQLSFLKENVLHYTKSLENSDTYQSELKSLASA